MLVKSRSDKQIPLPYIDERPGRVFVDRPDIDVEGGKPQTKLTLYSSINQTSCEVRIGHWIIDLTTKTSIYKERWCIFINLYTLFTSQWNRTDFRVFADINRKSKLFEVVDLLWINSQCLLAIKRINTRRFNWWVVLADLSGLNSMMATLLKL